MFAAFGLGELLRVFVRSNKILLPRHVCCLWTWGASLGQCQKQQNPSSEGKVVAFGSYEFHRVDGKGSRNPAMKAIWLPLAQISFIGVIAEAAEAQIQRHYSCLWL